MQRARVARVLPQQVIVTQKRSAGLLLDQLGKHLDRVRLELDHLTAEQIFGRRFLVVLTEARALKSQQRRWLIPRCRADADIGSTQVCVDLELWGEGDRARRARHLWGLRRRRLRSARRRGWRLHAQLGSWGRRGLLRRRLLLFLVVVVDVENRKIGDSRGGRRLRGRALLWG